MIRVLLCDPGKDEWLTAKRVLEGNAAAPLQIDWAQTVREAAQDIRAGAYDLCLVKDTFGGGRWAELVQQTDEQGRRVPVILLMTMAPEDHGAGAIRDGAADVLVPGEVSGPQLLRAIVRTVEREKRDSPAPGHPPSIPAPDSAVALLHRLDAALARARRGHTGVALLQVHLEGLTDLSFEQDLLAVQEINRRAHSCMREVDSLGQIDKEFVILLEDKDTDPVAARLAHDLAEVLAKPIDVPGGPVTLTPNVGIAAFPDDGKTSSDMLANAQAAVQTAIKAGPRRFRFRSKALNHRAAQRLKLQVALSGALERSEFQLLYQPQIDLSSREFVAVEALLRWHHEKLGNVPPGDFIPILESTGQIGAMEKWVITEACSHAREWLDDGHPVRVNINLSARQFQERDVGSELIKALAMFDVPGELFGVEITEGLLVDGNPELGNTFAELRKLGVAITVDDFGTGHSTLSFLGRCPIDVVKIDREFVRGLPDDKTNAGIAGAIVALAENLDLVAVAEGVELRAEEEFLRLLGCNLGQGFLYAPPLTAEDLVVWRDSRAKKP